MSQRSRTRAALVLVSAFLVQAGSATVAAVGWVEPLQDPTWTARPSVGSREPLDPTSIRTAGAQDQAKAEAGEQVYNTYCSTCHGDRLVSSGQTFDLRKLTADQRARFESSVLNGKNQMPPWRGALNETELDQIWHYIRSVNDNK